MPNFEKSTKITFRCLDKFIKDLPKSPSELNRFINEAIEDKIFVKKAKEINIEYKKGIDEEAK